jgi:hypothetical protein
VISTSGEAEAFAAGVNEEPASKFVALRVVESSAAATLYAQQLATSRKTGGKLRIRRLRDKQKRPSGTRRFTKVRKRQGSNRGDERHAGFDERASGFS